jgi:non-ribosomal peptide synthetase component F
MFVDSLLLRVDLSGRPSWRELLDRVRRASLTSYGNADVPFDTLAAALHRDRDLSRPPITPVMVNVLDGSLRPPDLGPGIHGRQLPLDPYHVRYELALDVTDASDDLLLALDYPVELFDATTVAGLLAALRRAATDLVTDPEASVIDTSENGDDDQTGGGQPAAAGAKVALPDETGATDFVDQVRAAWRVVLDTDEVPLDVNFLDAGGDSLLLVLLLDELNTLTDRKLQAADLFRSGTVAGQARLLRERQGDQPPAGDAAAADGTGGRGQLLDRARRVRAEEPAPEWTPSDQAGGRGP